MDAAVSLALLQEAELAEAKSYNYSHKKWHNQAGPGKLGPHPAEAAITVAPTVVTDEGHNLAKLTALKA